MTVRSRSLLFLPAVVTAIILVGPALEAQESLGVDKRIIMGKPQGIPLSGEELSQHTYELTSLMRCPVCQGLSIADSGSMIALAMKEEVRQFLAEGYTDDQILRYFEASYGEFIRLEPKARGFNLVVWIAPILAFLLGSSLVIYRWRRKPGTLESSERSPEESDLAAYRDKVRREIAS